MFPGIAHPASLFSLYWRWELAFVGGHEHERDGGTLAAFHHPAVVLRLLC
jgi:hypothetical protein